jgi:outer membrane murein-binding lipoprotein Lpp
MTDIEIAERVLAQLTDRLDRAVARVDALAGERQRVGFAVYADDDQSARAKLDKLNAEMATLATDIEGIRGALVEAKRRLAAAHAAVDRGTEREHVRAALATLDALLELAPRLRRIGEAPES